MLTCWSNGPMGPLIRLMKQETALFQWWCRRCRGPFWQACRSLCSPHSPTARWPHLVVPPDGLRSQSTRPPRCYCSPSLWPLISNPPWGWGSPKRGWESLTVAAWTIGILGPAARSSLVWFTYLTSTLWIPSLFSPSHVCRPRWWKGYGTIACFEKDETCSRVGSYLWSQRLPPPMTGWLAGPSLPWIPFD